MADKESEFLPMRAEVTALRAVLESAIAQDKAEGESHLTNLKRLLKHGFGYGEAASQFRSQGESLIQRANTAMSRVETLCDGTPRDNAGVPKELDQDTKDWRRRARDVRGMIPECIKLQKVEGWNGPSKINYDESVSIQMVGLEELEGVMLSTAQSCEAGASLNRAIFFAVMTAAEDVKEVVAKAPGASGDWYYVRTATAVPLLEALVEQVGHAISGEVAAGSADSLIGELHSTLTMPNLLVEGQWPTGRDGLGTLPAMTKDGVASDGSDADTDVDAQVDECLAGANL